MKKLYNFNSLNGFSRNLKKTAISLLASSVIASATLGFTHNTAYADGIVKLANTSHTQTLKVPAKKPKTYRTDIPFNEIIIGDPSIAIITPLTDQSFYVVGNKQGSTGIALYNEARELVGSLDVEVGADTAKLNRELKSALKGSGIKARSQNGKVVLSGKAKTTKQAAKARAIAKKFDKDAVDSLKVTNSVQVQLEVRFIEAQRRKNKEIGLNVYGAKSNSRFRGASGTTPIQTTNAAGNLVNVFGNALVSGSTPFAQVLGNIIAGGMSVDVLVQALESKGIARRLAEPNLVALSGDKASFLAGGEFPIPISGNDGQVSVEFKEFGVGLEFTPTVLDNGLINLQIEPEVSSIDTTNSVKFGNSGIEIPALIVRKAKTTIELRDGQSFVMAGLLQTTGNYDVRKFPWLGDLPIIGALFRSSSYRKNETDLVIIVTPRLVKPITPGTKIATPLDATAPPNEVDLFANGKTEVSRAKLRKVARAQDGIIKAGHILDF